MTLPCRDKAMTAASAIFERFSVPGAGVAMVAGGDSEAWGYGVCRVGGSQPVTADTTFQLASCSKAYTATAMAILVDRGELGWDDPVRKHLPEFQMHDGCLSELATLRDLLSMRLGYRNEGIVNWGRNLELGVETIFERLRYLDVIAGFREQFTYLNPAYTLIAEVIARRSGKSFVEFVRENVFQPLCQTATFIHEGQYLPTRPHAFPHVFLDNGVEPVGDARCGGRLGESCVYSTANDVTCWMRLHLAKGEVGGKRLVSQAAMAEMHRPQVWGPPVPALDNNFLAYGMGWQCRDTPHGPVLLHEGGEFGVSTFTLLDPKRSIGVAVYSNQTSNVPVKAACYALLDLLAGREPRDWATLFETLNAQEGEAIRTFLASQLQDKQEPLAEQDIAGSYFHPANGVADVRAVPGGFDFRLRDGWVYDGLLEPAGGNAYRSRPYYKGTAGMVRQYNLNLLFVRDEQGIALRAPGFGTMRKV